MISSSIIGPTAWRPRASRSSWRWRWEMDGDRPEKSKKVESPNKFYRGLEVHLGPAGSPGGPTTHLCGSGAPMPGGSSRARRSRSTPATSGSTGTAPMDTTVTRAARRTGAFSSDPRRLYQFAVSRGKPLMIGQWGVLERAPGDKAPWIPEAQTAARDKPPAIAAWWPSPSTHMFDWRVTTSPDTYEAFGERARDPYLNLPTSPSTPANPGPDPPPAPCPPERRACDGNGGDGAGRRPLGGTRRPPIAAVVAQPAQDDRPAPMGRERGGQRPPEAAGPSRSRATPPWGEPAASSTPWPGQLAGFLRRRRLGPSAPFLHPRAAAARPAAPRRRRHVQPPDPPGGPGGVVATVLGTGQAGSRGRWSGWSTATLAGPTAVAVDPAAPASRWPTPPTTGSAGWTWPPAPSPPWPAAGRRLGGDGGRRRPPCSTTPRPCGRPGGGAVHRRFGQRTRPGGRPHRHDHHRGGYGRGRLLRGRRPGHGRPVDGPRGLAGDAPATSTWPTTTITASGGSTLPGS